MKNRTILALGADIKNRALLAKGDDFYYGTDTGDLADARNYESFRRGILRLLREVKTPPDIIAYDLHPGYFSTRFAKEYSESLPSLDTRAVQHHHAHIASVMQEYGIKGPVIGVSFDGTGYGTDATMWGGEFLIVDKSGFERAAHLRYWKMPGSDKVVSEPWRMVLSVLGRKGSRFLKSVPKEDKELVLGMIQKDLNAPLTSSAGRLFDAAAAFLGVCEYASYEAEGPIKLEAMCQEGVKDTYKFSTKKRDGIYEIDTEDLFLGMVNDIKQKKKKEFIAAKFHNSIVEIIVRTVKKLSKLKGIDDIALSGGVFQNMYLRERVIRKLSHTKLTVFINNASPVTDLNIALGQYYVSCGTGKN
jgi:hydrogenase maturation protein HypF